jgi:hypothetical protein
VERIEDESFRLFRPGFADVFVGCEAFEGLEALCKVVSADEVREVGTELIVGFIVEAFDGRVLDGAVHALDAPRGLLVQLGEGELRGPVTGDEEIEPALCGTDFSDVDVEVADRVDLELAL